MAGCHSPSALRQQDKLAYHPPPVAYKGPPSRWRGIRYWAPTRRNRRLKRRSEPGLDLLWRPSNILAGTQQRVPGESAEVGRRGGGVLRRGAIDSAKPRTQGSPNHGVEAPVSAPLGDLRSAGGVFRHRPWPQADRMDGCSLAAGQRGLRRSPREAIQLAPQGRDGRRPRRQRQRQSSIARDPSELERQGRTIDVPIANTAQNTGVPDQRAPSDTHDPHALLPIATSHPTSYGLVSAAPARPPEQLRGRQRVPPTQERRQGREANGAAHSRR